MKEYLKNKINIFAVIVVYVLFIWLTGIGCPFQFLFGIPCMGCGMTRACIALINMDVKTALYYHPLVFFGPVILILICFEDKLNEKHEILMRKIWIIIFIVFLITYLIRLVDTTHSAIQIKIKDSFIFYVIKLFWKGEFIW